MAKPLEQLLEEPEYLGSIPAPYKSFFSKVVGI